MITVAIPIGPNIKVYKRYFQECLDSLKEQVIPPSEVLLVDDMAGLEHWKIDYGDLPITIHTNPWRLGAAASYNIAVAVAKYNLVMLLGSDDKLFPWAIEDCLRAWEEHKDPLGYYYCDVEYSNGDRQGCAAGSAMVTKKLWERCGGYAPAMAVGAFDSMLLSIFLSHPDAGTIIHVESENPPFWHRLHDGQSVNRGDLQNSIHEVRSVLSIIWERPDWTRNHDKRSHIR